MSPCTVTCHAFLPHKVMTFPSHRFQKGSRFYSHRPTDYRHHSAPLRLSSVLVSSAAKIFRLSLGCHPWMVSLAAVGPLPLVTPLVSHI